MIRFGNRKILITIRLLGAKMVGLKYFAGKNPIELLYLPVAENKKDKLKFNRLPKRGDVFDETRAWGGDICAPTVSKCIFKAGCQNCECESCEKHEMKAQDHGDFWTVPFKIKKQGKTSVVLSGDSKEFRLEIEFKLKGSSLLRTYKVTNLTKYKLPFTFADHLLLPINDRLDPSEYIDLPRVRKMRVEWSFREKLGAKNSMANWPLKRKKPFADKLFAPLKKGRDGVFLVRYKGYSNYNGYNLELSSKELSWIGYWHTEKGWPASSTGKNGQSNLGLELTNTDRDNLTECVESGKVWWIQPGKSKKWGIRLKVD